MNSDSTYGDEQEALGNGCGGGETSFHIKEIRAQNRENLSAQGFYGGRCPACPLHQLSLVGGSRAKRHSESAAQEDGQAVTGANMHVTCVAHHVLKEKRWY